MFHRVALERGLIPADLPAQKNCVRDYLRQQDLEDQWTQMQGEVYGVRITEAESFPGVLPSLQTLAQAGWSMGIVSHKTRTPYQGPVYDLHQSARSWLTNQGFFSPEGLDWNRNQIFFELTKEEKVKRIVELGCSHYIDDLPEILEMLPATVQPILFAPGGKVRVPEGWHQFHHWRDVPQLLVQLA
ncbi:hypothetical protein [Spirulina major]|uniref:hypothetical protein n=1 Tax=Spirulina major TaxID=270636 RepID=UPI001114D11C|nr:hypothetical protein [Spirulina major]